MKPACFLAFDFGASSGRAMLGRLDEKLILTEVHRFVNRPLQEGGHMRWDTDLFRKSMVKGLVNGIAMADGPVQGAGIDTWGVDFGLLDGKGALIEKPVCYRDGRTDGMMEKVFERLPAEDIYRITGIQFMQLNTIFQVFSLFDSGDPAAEKAEHLLFMPDLLSYMLTGKRQSEYSIASTSQMLEAKTGKWSGLLFERLGIPQKWMQNIYASGTVIGPLKDEIAAEAGEQVPIFAPAGHDTACAVAAVPARAHKNWAYLSSGTWSLLGIETERPIVSDESFKGNFTNEGGVGGRIRFLRNVMGLWLLERSIHVWERGGSADYSVLLKEAGEAEPFFAVIDPDDQRFLNPENMVTAIQEFCRETDQKVPDNRGSIVRVILESLALKYRFVLERIEALSGNKMDCIHVVGGGSQNALLNQFTADATGVEVITGPVEATAAGNILVQAIGAGLIKDLAEAREIVEASFPLGSFLPRDADRWDENYQQEKHRFN